MANSSKHHWPEGAFSFDDWWQRDEVRQDDTQYTVAQRAFEAGYVSAVRHHDSAMRRLAEVDPLEL